MQRLQKMDENGFMSPENIAKELAVGYERRKLRSSQRGDEVFVSSDLFFDNLLNDWVIGRTRLELHDSRTLSSLHKVAGLMNSNDVTDEWWRCFLTNPFDSSPLYAPPQQGFTSPFLFKKQAHNTAVKVI